MNKRNSLIICPMCNVQFEVTPSQCDNLQQEFRCGNCFSLFKLSSVVARKKVSLDQKTITINKKTLSMSNAKKQGISSKRSSSESDSVKFYDISNKDIKKFFYIIPPIFGILLLMVFFVGSKDSDNETLVYQWFCGNVGCDSSPSADVNAIRTLELFVQKKVGNVNYINVDAVIINQAKFDQPWPNIVLIFSDIHGNVLMKKVFQPNDYIGGELTNNDLMPHNQAIRLSLDVANPGENAVSYHLMFEKHIAKKSR